MGSGTPATRALPRGACYLNASHYGLAVPGAFDWLARRPDVKAVFFLHDLLPLETPEYFRPSERARHEIRLGNLARRGAGAIVSTRVSLRPRSLVYWNASVAAICRFWVGAAIGRAHISRTRRGGRGARRARPYFIQCGTIEPRKKFNSTMLHVVRQSMARHGPRAPKLVLVGRRGWENENVVDLLERAPTLRGYVLEASGMPTPVLRRLLASARALLMPVVRRRVRPAARRGARGRHARHRLGHPRVSRDRGRRLHRHRPDRRRRLDARDRGPFRRIARAPVPIPPRTRTVLPARGEFHRFAMSARLASRRIFGRADFVFLHFLQLFAAAPDSIISDPTAERDDLGLLGERRRVSRLLGAAPSLIGHISAVRHPGRPAR